MPGTLAIDLGSSTTVVAWHDGSAAPPRLDLDGNGTVLAGDVLALLSLWAVACP